VPGDEGCPLTYSLEELWTCLNSDTTILNNYNAKFAMQFTKMNRFDFFFNGAEKVRNARDASDLRPLETTYRQLASPAPTSAPVGGRPACRRPTSGATATCSATAS